MSTPNKAVFTNYIRAIDERKFDIMASHVSPDATFTFTGVPHPMNLEQAGAFFGEFIGAFPDVHHVVEEQIAEGDRVMSRLTVKGTHHGPFQGLPATGRPVSFTAINITSVVDGKITRNDITMDAATMMQQLTA